jgi:hypothetical protein
MVFPIYNAVNKWRMLELGARTQMDWQKIDQLPYFSDKSESIIVEMS